MVLYIESLREQVLAIQKDLDPIGVLEIKQMRLKRTVYHNKGPNSLLHVDGYDKFKRFCFAIHGCVCGYMCVDVLYVVKL